MDAELTAAIAASAVALKHAIQNQPAGIPKAGFAPASISANEAGAWVAAAMPALVAYEISARAHAAVLETLTGTTPAEDIRAIKERERPRHEPEYEPEAGRDQALPDLAEPGSAPPP